jgi:FMN phosphatase YigB (HAD superfamily)
MAYKYLIFDADHTLIDFARDEKEAFRLILADCGIPTSDEVLETCRALSEQTWNEVGLSDVYDRRIQRVYHRLYRGHLKLLFTRIFALYPPTAPLSPVAAGERFLKYLEADGLPMQNVESVLSALSRTDYKLCVATNGLHDIQSGRLAPLADFFYRIYVSEDLNVIKPLPAFFEKILLDLSASADECLMIGDSLSSDMVGALSVGMDRCWLNPHKLDNPDVPVTYEIRDLSELLDILGVK